MNFSVQEKRLWRMTACISICLVSACATVNPNSHEPSQISQAQRVDEMLSEWKEAKPGIRRLVELESDLKLLITEISRASELNDQAPQFRNAATNTPSDSSNQQNQKQQVRIVRPINEPSPVEKAPETQQMEAKNKGLDRKCRRYLDDYNGTIGLHLMSVSDEKNIGKGWTKLQSDYPQLLCDKQLLVENVQVKGEKYYSMRIGPYETYEQARADCDQLKLRGQYCSLIQYTGTVHQ